jgi:hypothetical protein
MLAPHLLCFPSWTDKSTDVMEFISCRRYETLSLHYVLQKFSTADCDWLMPPGHRARQQARVSVSDALKRRELLEDFLFWYFDSFVLPLLRVRFHFLQTLDRKELISRSLSMLRIHQRFGIKCSTSVMTIGEHCVLPSLKDLLRSHSRNSKMWVSSASMFLYVGLKWNLDRGGRDPPTTSTWFLVCSLAA